jgi:hypothetical protein
VRAFARSSAPALRRPLFHQQSRGVLPIPALALTAAKFGGAAILKKLALSRVIQRIGPDRAIGAARALNQQLRSSGVRYSGEVADAADESLLLLERSLGALRGDERIGALWSWYSTLEKNNPTLAAAVLKTWIESLPGVKWASTLLSTPSEASKPSDGSGGGATSTDGSATRAEADTADLRASALVQKIRESHPEAFDDYHIVLVPKADVQAAGAAERAGSGPKGS